MNVKKRNVKHIDDNEILSNLSNCINDKMAILNINLSQLANEAEVDYYSLRKIVNHEENYLPNTRILLKLANYLNIKVGDLLNYSDLPQYIPIIDQSQIFAFLNETFEVHGFKNKILSPKFIHKHAFAIKELNTDLLTPAEIIYTCYPSSNKSTAIGQVYLFELLSESHTELIFGRVVNIYEERIEISIARKKIILEDYKVIAIIVNMQMSESLI